MSMNRVLTTGEVARFCGVNFRTVLRWIERGQIQAYRLPGRGDHRIKMDDFLAFLSDNELPVPEEFSPRAMRILIVEDADRFDRNVLRTMEQSGFDIMIASDAFRAGALLGTFAPAIMILDLQMLGIDGLDVVQYVRSIPSLERTKLIVLCGQHEQIHEKARYLGADAVISKPIAAEEFIHTVMKLAEEAGAIPAHA